MCVVPKLGIPRLRLACPNLEYFPIYIHKVKIFDLRQLAGVLFFKFCFNEVVLKFKILFQFILQKS